MPGPGKEILYHRFFRRQEPEKIFFASLKYLLKFLLMSATLSPVAKYDALRKLSRNADVRQYRGDHPEMSLEQIGEHFGISAARVHQILNNNHKKARNAPEA